MLDRRELGRGWVTMPMVNRVVFCQYGWFLTRIHTPATIATKPTVNSAERLSVSTNRTRPMVNACWIGESPGRTSGWCGTIWR